jgi:hypothetical protein
MDSEIKIPQRPTIDCNLITSYALQILKPKLPELEQLEAAARRCDYYPDGTLLLEGPGVFTTLWDLLPKRRLLVDGGIWQPKGFGGLKPLSEKGYALWYTTDYREGLGELDFNIIFPSMWTCPTNDYHLESLLISIGFKGKPSPEIRLRFAASLEQWFRSMSREGVFGEGPINPISRTLEFRGRLAQFRIDASRSGQDTLNGLLLLGLEFGYEVSPVSDFVFDHEEKLQTFLDFPIATTVEAVSLQLP